MGTVSKIALLLALSFGSAACQSGSSRATVTNISYRGLTAQEIQRRGEELDAQLIAQKGLDQSTFVVYETDTAFKFGRNFAEVHQDSDGKVLDLPQQSLQSVNKNPQQKATVIEFSAGITRVNNNRITLSQDSGYVLAVIQDSKLLQATDAVKYVFKDKTKSETVPTDGQKALIYTYDTADGNCCAQVDFLAKNGQVLHARAKGIQIFP